MRMLSDILDIPVVLINNGVIRFGADGKINHRRITSKPFSNWPVNTVRYNNETFLINESWLEVQHEQA